MSHKSSSEREVVSVIIVNYNAGDLLTACVCYALKRARQVIVMDSTSSDSSLKTLSDEYAGAESLRIIRIHLCGKVKNCTKS